MKHLIDKLLNKYRIFTLTTIILVGLLFLTIYVVVPNVKNIFEKRQTIENRKIVLDKLTTKRRLLDSMTRSDNLKFYDEAMKALPSEKDAAGILIAIDNLVQKTQFTVNSIDFSPGEISTKSAETANTASGDRKKGANFMPLNVSASGKTADFLAFISELPKIRPLFDIYGMTVNYETDKDTLTANFKLNSFYLLPITEIGGVESALPEISTAEKEMLSNLVNIPYLGSLPQETSGMLPVGKSDLFSP